MVSSLAVLIDDCLVMSDGDKIAKCSCYESQLSMFCQMPLCVKSAFLLLRPSLAPVSVVSSSCVPNFERASKPSVENLMAVVTGWIYAFFIVLDYLCVGNVGDETLLYEHFLTIGFYKNAVGGAGYATTLQIEVSVCFVLSSA